MRFYNSATPAMSVLSDEELDEIIGRILQIFPLFSREMITGHLRHQGHRVPRERISASYQRVMGLPAYMVSRRLERRVYRVAGPNALWHHDGQHCESFCSHPANKLSTYLALIRWRVVIHAFVDGHSRFVTAIQASNNNRAQTVFQLFLNAIEVHGTPSRVRGDHGVENVDVAAYMQEHYGAERGSYIWGRCFRLFDHPAPFSLLLGVFTISESNGFGWT
jgi:hypothetical protein